MLGDDKGEKLRVASCSCGALGVTVRGEPTRVNICGCFQCQRGTGSAFSYTGFFPDAAVVSIEGEYGTWRSYAENGNWQDTSFCPRCGTRVFSRLQSMRGDIAFPAGCFNDSDFPPPTAFYWTSKKHHWLAVPPGIEAFETQ
jgi:hypothetical protein